MAVDAETGQQQWREDGEQRLQPEQERLLQAAEEARPAEQAAGKLADKSAGGPAGSRRQPPQAPQQPRAPDGGWGWLVAAAVAYVVTATMGPAFTTPFVFADYLEEIGQGSQGMTTLLSIWMTFSSVSGLFCNKLFRRFSCRQVGWLGVAIMAVGQGPVAFATEYWHFILANMCGGFGMGLVFPACFTCFNIYFDRRKTFAMGLTQLGLGLATFGFPMLVQHVVATLGFRMAQLIICAINVSAIPVLTILRPLQRKNPDQSAGARPPARGSILKSLSVDHINERNDQLRDGAETQTRRSHHSAGNLSSQAQRPSRPASTVKEGPAPRSAAGRNYRRWWSAVVDFLDLKLMLDFSIANTLVGVSVVFFVDMMYMTVIPLYLFNTGLSRSDAALAMSVMTFSDIGGRLSMVLIGACGFTKNRILFLLGTTVCTSFRTMLIFFVDFTPIVTLAVLMGFFRNYVTSTMPLVVGETCSNERFPAAYGLHTVMSGFLYITIGPLIGLLKDVTNSFMASVATLDVIALLCVVSWILEMIVTYKRKREKLAPNT